MLQKHMLTKLEKVVITFFVIYEIAFFFVLTDNGYNGACRYLFSRDFCEETYRYFVVMGLPLILSALLYMWKPEICTGYKNRKKEGQNRVKILQDYFTSVLKNAKKPVNADNLTYIRDVIVDKKSDRKLKESFISLLHKNNIDIVAAMDVLDTMIDNSTSVSDKQASRYWIDED